MRFNTVKATLIEMVQINKKALISLMNEGGRDFELQKLFFNKYIEFQRAHDVLEDEEGKSEREKS